MLKRHKTKALISLLATLVTATVLMMGLPAMAETVQPAAQAAITVEDQTIKVAQVVTISKVTIDRAGWIALYRAQSGNVTGNQTANQTAAQTPQPDLSRVLGKTYLRAGNYTDVQIVIDNVSENISQGDTLCAVLHYDQPADQRFTFTPQNNQDPIVQIGGQRIIKCFTVSRVLREGEREQIRPAVTVDDQAISTNRTIIIARVTIDRPGWLVLYPATETASPNLTAERARPDVLSPLGRTYVDAGTTTDVQMILAQNATANLTAAGKIICAVLHYDQPADRQFTFTTENNQDPAVKLAGQDVQDCFTIRSSSQYRQPGS